MLITDIEVHLIHPRLQDFNAADIVRYHGSTFQARTIFVMHTDIGLQGLGETLGPVSNIDQLRERYIGTNPFDWVNSEIDLPLNMATYDLMGKSLNVPAWKLMGHKVRSWVPVCAWTVALEPKAMAEEVKQAVQGGYRWIKFHTGEVQNVIDQTEAMQEVAPAGFKIHYDFNANSDSYTMRPILSELEKFTVAGRFEDVVEAVDEDGYRMLREHSSLPIIVHHGPPEFMIKGIVDGYMAGHAPIGSALKASAVAEMTKTPFMLQQCGGFINRAFLAHQVAVMRMATIDHVDICHLWKEDVTVQSLGVVSGSVQVPEGPGLGVELDRNKLERCINEPFEPPPSLVRVSHGDGLKVYVRHNPNLPGCNDNLRFYDRLHGFSVPGPEPSYANKVVCDFWEGDDNPEKFKLLWEKTASGPIWTNDE